MGTYFLAPTQNHLQKTLSGALSDSANTITLNNTTSLLAPGYNVIDRENSTGTATPDAREVVFYPAISGPEVTCWVRGADNSTNRTHADGAIVETFPSVGMWNNLATITSTAIDSNGYLKAIPSPVSIARMQITQTAVSSIASIARAEIATLIVGDIPSLSVSSIASIAQIVAPRASLAGVTITTSINASGASIVGFGLSKTGEFTRDLTAANATVAYTGVGFKPTSIAIYGTMSLTSQSFGNADSDRSASGIYRNGATSNLLSEAGANVVCYAESIANNFQTAIVASYDNDGFSLAWSKVNSPTGTAYFAYIAKR